MNDATQSSAGRGWNGDPNSGDPHPKAPTWDGAAVPSQGGAETPPWDATPAPQSGPPSAWGVPQQASGPPVIGWNQSIPPEPTTWGVPQPLPNENATRVIPLSPAPAKSRGRLAGWIAAIVAAALAFGIGGYFLGSSSGDPSTEPTTRTPSLPMFEAKQAAANREKLSGEFTGLAGPWLRTVLSCVANTEQGAPKLTPDESRHVTCRYGAAWVHFVVYKGAEQKNAARTYRQQLNLNSDEVAPGVQDPGRVTGGVSKAPGRVIEYAYRLSNGRALCGMSWERDEDPLAATMIEGYCEEDFGGDWGVLRDLWQRHS